MDRINLTAASVFSVFFVVYLSQTMQVVFIYYTVSNQRELPAPLGLDLDTLNSLVTPM